MLETRMSNAQNAYFAVGFNHLPNFFEPGAALRLVSVPVERSHHILAGPFSTTERDIEAFY